MYATSTQKKAKSIGDEYGVAYSSSVTKLVDRLDNKPDIAFIAVPHSGYLEIIRDVAELNIDIIKEKPFATSCSEALEIIKIVKKYNISLYVTLQRRFNPIFTSFKQLTDRIGHMHAIEGRYTMNIARLDTGWRASSFIHGAEPL